MCGPSELELNLWNTYWKFREQTWNYPNRHDSATFAYEVHYPLVHFKLTHADLWTGRSKSNNLPGTDPGTHYRSNSGSDGTATSGVDESFAGILHATALHHFVQFKAGSSALAENGSRRVSALLSHCEVVGGHQVASSAFGCKGPEGAAVRAQAKRLAVLKIE